MPKLSHRLQKIFDLSHGRELWDIGCDHALLAAHNARVGKFSRVFCVDRSPNVIGRLPKRLTLEYGLNEDELTGIQAICADAAKLDWSQVEGTVVMAGFGCQNISRVLETVAVQDWNRINWVVAPQDGPELAITTIQFRFNKAPFTYEIQENGRKRFLLHSTPTQ